MKRRNVPLTVFWLSVVLALDLVWAGYCIGYSEVVSSPLKFYESDYKPTIEYVINDLPNISGKINVYRLVPKRIGKARSLELAKLFSMHPEDGANSFTRKSGYTYKKGSSRLFIGNNGKIVYFLEEETERDLLLLHGAPPDEETARIASEFLMQRGLMPKDVFVAQVKEWRMLAYGDGTAPDVWIVRTKRVMFHRKIDGKEVFGVDKIRVHIGEDGLIMDASILHHDVELYGKVALRSVEEAVADLKKGKGMVRVERDQPISLKGFTPVKCIIDKIELGYFEADDIRRAPYLYPVYRMTGKAVHAGGREKSYTAIIDATTFPWILTPR